VQTANEQTANVSTPDWKSVVWAADSWFPVSTKHIRHGLDKNYVDLSVRDQNLFSLLDNFQSDMKGCMHSDAHACKDAAIDKWSPGDVLRLQLFVYSIVYCLSLVLPLYVMIIYMWSKEKNTPDLKPRDFYFGALVFLAVFVWSMKNILGPLHDWGLIFSIVSGVLMIVPGIYLCFQQIADSSESVSLYNKYHLPLQTSLAFLTISASLHIQFDEASYHGVDEMNMALSSIIPPLVWSILVWIMALFVPMREAHEGLRCSKRIVMSVMLAVMVIALTMWRAIVTEPEKRLNMEFYVVFQVLGVLGPLILFCCGIGICSICT